MTRNEPFAQHTSGQHGPSHDRAAFHSPLLHHRHHAPVHGFNLIAVKVVHKSSVVGIAVLCTRPWLARICCSSCDGCLVPFVDFSRRACCESDVCSIAYGGWLLVQRPVDPEFWSVFSICDRCETMIQAASPLSGTSMMIFSPNTGKIAS
eukprot:TRINITY_DN4918_c0_g1_i2.p1 TRINITY_DN4918_c0_g1~~TRINITY_DN4918_c0_g1_i2.p1  ORF type:complete len:150 (-),score=7.95 TRINITY_DN4918_c0_g1_i2:67-516(-)